MASNFFSRFPMINYSVGEDKNNTVLLTDIIKNVDVSDFYINDSTFYTYYEINDGDRPDTVSYKLYGTTEYYWTFFILNNSLRSGLNASWPLSYGQFESMIEREYDSYSVLSFYPLNSIAGISHNGIASNGVMGLTLLTSEYLPYLRIYNESNNYSAKILKYDASLLQLYVYDVRDANNNETLAIETFLSPTLNETFRLKWVGESEDDKIDYAIKAYDLIYADIDTVTNMAEGVDGSTDSEIQEIINLNKMNYIFGKSFKSHPTLHWMSSRNAAAVYFEKDEHTSELRSVAAYDVITNQIPVYSYASNYESEQNENSKKERIRIIRPDRINIFAETYFNILNS